MTEKEFKEEAETLRPALQKRAYCLLGNADDADDAAQDALLKLWDMHTELRCPMAPLAYVLVRNLCVDRLRHRHPSVSTADVDLPAQPPDTAREALADRMMAIVSTLPAQQQVALRLKHIDGMGTEAIANLTGCSAEAVRQALSRARRAVLKKFSEDEENAQ